MTQLQQFRDHARHMAAFKPGRPSTECAGNHNPWTVTTWRDPDHEACTDHRCGCSCHTPTRADRALWRQLADEIDAHLNRDTDEQPELG